jgi:hypothetical protein
MAVPWSPIPQQHQWFTWRCVALLGFAMLAPTGLPAGGGNCRLPEVRRRERDSEPLISAASAALHCSPQRQAPVLIRLQSGVPLRVLRQWFCPDGNQWLHVQQIHSSGHAAKGWLKS